MAVKIKDPSLADGQSRYQKLLSQARQVRQDRDAAGVNDAYISSFLTDSDKFLTDSQSQLNSMNWSSATDRSRANRREEQLSDLGYRAGVIGKYLEANKGTMDEKTYGTLSRTLKNYSDKFDAAKNAFAANSKYYSQFGSQRDYDRYINYSGKTADELTALLEKQTDSTERAWLSSYIQQLRDQETAAETRKNLEYLDELDKEFDQQWYDYNNVVNRGGIAGATPMQNERAQIMFENTMQARKDTLAKVTEKDRYEWAGIKLTENALKDKDFAAYAKKGAAVENPNMADVLKSGGLFGSSQKPVNKVMYTLQNWDAYEKLKFSNNNPVLGTVDASAYGLYDLAPHMTADEVNIYNYYLGKDMAEGTNKADEYLRFMEETLNARKGAAHAGELQGKTALELGYAAVAGLDQFVQGVKNVGSMFSWDSQSNYVPTSSAQAAGSIIREDLKDDTIPMWYNFKTGKWESTIAGNSLGQMAYDTIQTSANMAPSILLSTAVGIVNPAAGAAVGGALLGASAAGNAYQQKIQAGYTQSQARSYGALVGISEAVLETALGAVGGAAGKGLKGVLSKVSQTGIQKIDDVLARVAKTAGGKIATNALGEGVEEAIQSILEPAFAHVVAGEEFTFDMEETLYSALLGAVMGAGFGAASPNTYQGNIPGISANEKTQLKTVLDERVKSREESLGRKLTAAEKLDIEIAVRNEIITQRGNEAAAPVQGTAPSGASPSAQQQTVSQPRQDATAAVPGQQNVSAPAQKPDGLGIVQELLEAAKPDPIFDALKSYRDSGIVSNKKAEAILANPEALQQLTQQTGIPIEGTKSQQRAAVKEAVAKIDEPPVDNTAAATYDNTINQGGSTYAEQETGTTYATRSIGSNNDFAGLQAESRGTSFEDIRQRKLGTEDNEAVRSRLSAALGGELERRGLRHGNDDGIHLTSGNGTVFDMLPVDADTFHDIFEVARKYTKNGELVDLHEVKTTEDSIGYDNCENYLSSDGMSGFSITPDGDLISVFNAHGAKKKGFLRAIAPVVRSKVKTLDCYMSQAQPLHEIYEKVFGMKIASVMDHNMLFDRDNIAANHNRPKVAFMVNSDENVETKFFNENDYDAAKDYQLSCVPKATSGSPDSVGAAPAGFDQYSNLQYQYGNKPDRANTARDINVPNRDSQGRRVSDYAANIYGNEITSDQMIPELEKRIAAGEFGADVKHLTDTKENSFNHINDVGIEKSADEVKNAVSKGEYSDDLLAQAQILYANYQAKGDMVKAGDMAVYAAEIARAGGRILNVAKMTRMLTPDGQLEARLRLAELADQRIKKKKKNAKAVSVSKETQQKFKNVSTAGETVITDAANELSDAAKVDYAAAAKAAMEKASAKNPEIADQISDEAQLTPEQKGILYGDRIAKANETKAEAEEVTEDKVYNAIMEFVDSKKKKTATPKTKKAALDALAQYYGNKAEFQEVWSAARRRAESKLANDARATEILQQFFDSVLPQNVTDAQDANSVSGKAIRQAAEGAGVDLQSLIAKSAEDKAAALAEIQKYVQSTYNLDESSASEMATQLQESFFEELSRRQTKRLLSMFGQKDAEPKTQQSVMDKFRELYNLGAFTKDASISRDALKKLFGADGLTLSDEVLRQYGEISDARKAEMDQRILQEIADQIPSSFAEVYRKWRYTSMLANPSTHIKNMSGNFGMFLMQYGLKDSVAAGIETVGSLVSGGKMKRTKSFLNPLSKKDGQLVSNAWNDYGTIMNNDGEVAQRVKNGGKYYSQQSEIQKLKKTFAPLDAVSNFNTAAMDVEDAIFGRTAYSLSLAGYMKANKLTEITEEARAYAISQAQEATFHDDSLIYQKVRNHIKDGNVVVPFVKTPANVTSRAIEYSPGMLIKSGWDIVQAARGKDGYTAAKAINNASKGLVGSALYGVGAWLAAQGLLRVVGSGDDETREYEKMMGYKDFSICIGGTYISADFLTPAIVPLLTGASIWESAQNLSDGNISFTDALNAIYSVTDPIISSSMLSSLDGMMYAIRSMDEAQPGELVGTILLELGKSYISQSIPSLVRRIASASDNTAREIYQDSENPLDYYWQNIMGSIPGTTQTLKTKYDVWGQPFKRNDVENDAAGWIFSAITPSNIYDVHETPLDEEILRLQKAGFDALPSANPKALTIDGEKVRLTQDQYETYERVEGQTSYAFAEQIMESESYKAMTDEQKSEVLNAAYKVANELGKISALGKSYTPDNSGINKYYAMAEENGIDPQVFFTDVYAQYKIIGDSDEKPSRKALQFASHLETLEADGVITEEQKFVIKDTMKFWQQMPAQTEKYDSYVNAGLSSDKASFVMDLLASLTPPSGKKEPTTSQKITAITGADNELTERQQAVVLKETLSDPAYEKYLAILKKGYNNDEYAISYEIYTREKAIGGESTKDRTIEMFQKRFNLSESAATALYEIYNPK